MTESRQPDGGLVLTALQDQLAQADKWAVQELLLRLAREWWRLQRHEEAMRAYCEVYALALLDTSDQVALLRAVLGLGRCYLQKVRGSRRSFCSSVG